MKRNLHVDCINLFCIIRGGVLFGYYFIAPFALSFLAGYELVDTLATPTLNSYINYMIMFTLPVGIVFEMPVVSFFSPELGILTPRMMRTGRRYAVIIILIVAAILTPSPDVISQMILATPLYVLYEMSIAVSARVSKKLEKERK
jgi:sec-independent protein translocase protein TatC